MGLRAKFNLIMVCVFLTGMAGLGFVSYEVLQRNAQEEILHIAEVMMESATSIRGYTVDEIRPLLNAQLAHEFLPQTVPAYAARKNIERLRQNYPDYTYKEATLNPTNPASRATDWESTIVDYFRSNREERKLIGVRKTATGPSLYVARPIQVKNQNCLVCHGERRAAPETMVAQYGEANGFGWKLEEIVGSQIVSIPMSVSLERAQSTLWTFLIAASAIFLIVIGILNILLHYVVIKPVRQMSNIAHAVSMGKLEVPEYKPKGNDEVASLAESFNRMRRSLVNAMKILDE
ncbi:MAG: c-type heme family protein [Planctomycetota bacterium]